MTKPEQRVTDGDLDRIIHRLLALGMPGDISKDERAERVLDMRGELIDVAMELVEWRRTR